MKRFWTVGLMLVLGLFLSCSSSSNDEQTGDALTDISADMTQDLAVDLPGEDNVIPTDNVEDNTPLDVEDTELPPDVVEDTTPDVVLEGIPFGGRCGYGPHCNLEMWTEQCTVDEELDNACWQEAQMACMDESCDTGTCWTFVVGNYLNFSHSYCTKTCVVDADCADADGPWGSDWSCVQMAGAWGSSEGYCMPTAETEPNISGDPSWSFCITDGDCTAEDHSCQIAAVDLGYGPKGACVHKNMGDTVGVGEACVFNEDTLVYETDCENGFGSCLSGFGDMCSRLCSCMDGESQAACDARECGAVTDWTCGSDVSKFGKVWQMCHPKTDCIAAGNECSDENFCQASFNGTPNDPRFIYYCEEKLGDGAVAYGETCDEADETVDKTYCENEGWCLNNGFCSKTCGATADCSGVGDGFAVCATDEYSIDLGWFDADPLWEVVALQYCLPMESDTQCFDGMTYQCDEGAGEVCTYVLTPETSQAAAASHSLQMFCTPEDTEATAEYGEVCGADLEINCKSGLCVGSEEDGYRCTHPCLVATDCGDFEIEEEGVTYVVQSYCSLIRVGQLMDMDVTNDVYAPVCLTAETYPLDDGASSSFTECVVDEAGVVGCDPLGDIDQVCTPVVLSTDANHPAWSYGLCTEKMASVLFPSNLPNGATCDYDNQCASRNCILGEYDDELTQYLALEGVGGAACTVVDSTQTDGECGDGEVCAAMVHTDGTYSGAQCVAEDDAYVANVVVSAGYCSVLCDPETDGDSMCQGTFGLDDSNATCGDIVVLERPTVENSGVMHFCMKP